MAQTRLGADIILTAIERSATAGEKTNIDPLVVQAYLTVFIAARESLRKVLRGYNDVFTEIATKINLRAPNSRVRRRVLKELSRCTSRRMCSTYANTLTYCDICDIIALCVSLQETPIDYEEVII